MGTPMGCACNETCICLQCECCCKNNLEPYMYPACYCCGIACESPSTCCKSESMCCCLFAACAFPPDEEVPLHDCNVLHHVLSNYGMLQHHWNCQGRRRRFMKCTGNEQCSKICGRDTGSQSSDERQLALLLS